MPHSTFCYVFEAKVRGFAAELAHRLSGQSKSSFVLTLDLSGSTTGLWFAPPDGTHWHDWTKELSATGVAWLFYDPFEAPEYTWVAWHRIARATMERLAGAEFEDRDFVCLRPMQTADLPEQVQFPSDWGVMF